MEFPIFNSKSLSDGKTYDLTEPASRLEYFHSKIGKKIEDIKSYLDNNTFIGYIMAKKQAGKGTYSKMLGEVLGPDRFEHISVGDIVRKYHDKLVADRQFLSTIKDSLSGLYRGTVDLDTAIQGLIDRSHDKVSVQDELILALLKLEIGENNRKALFIDGLPRSSDQISYALFFRDLINYRYDPDFFVLIQLEEAMIDARMKNRVVCPICGMSKNYLSNPSSIVYWDSSTNSVRFKCDSSVCPGYNKQDLAQKEGDSLGKEFIRDRLDTDDQLLKKAYSLHGIPKILLTSSVPVSEASNYLEDYEIQPTISFEFRNGQIVREDKPWIFLADNGVESCTWYPAVYVLHLIDQLHTTLKL